MSGTGPRPRRRGRHGRSAARRAAPARRQVDQPSRAAAGGPGRRARAGSAAAGDGADVRSTAGHRPGAGRDGGARPRGRADRRLSRGLARGRWAPPAGSHARLRQLRHEPAADERGPRRAADDGHPRRRRFIARPSGGSYHRTAALDGGVAPCPAERFPSSPDRDRSYPADGHRLHHTRPERPGEVGGPAGRPSGRWSDDRSGGGRDARSHGADAPGRGACPWSVATDRARR